MQMTNSLTFDNLVEAITSLFKLNESFGKAEQEPRRKIGLWLVEVGMLVESISWDLENNMFPFTSCSKMPYMIDNLASTVGNVLTYKETQDLLEKFNQARNIEQMVGELRQLDIILKDNKLTELKQIACTLQQAGSVLANR